VEVFFKNWDSNLKAWEDIMKKLVYFNMLLGAFGLLVLGCQNTQNPVEITDSQQNQSTSLTKSGVNTWHVPADFATIQDAIDDATVLVGDVILVGPGDHAGALVDKAVEIKGIGGATIIGGPVHGSGLIQGFRLLAGSDGCTISHLIFATDLSIMNGAAIADVTVTQCTFINSVQAISNWRGNRWEISHNKITDLRTRCGGGIGILVADFTGGTVSDNVVSHNTVTGTLHVDPNDCGGYNGTGIVLFADFRFGGSGATAISDNRVVKNKVSLISDTPAVVDVAAIELTEHGTVAAGWPPSPPLTHVIFDNAIGFNDLRGTALQIVSTPATLDNPVNDISRNLGNNRGHGSHPNLFGPGGN
jgi:hypothetical protein